MPKFLSQASRNLGQVARIWIIRAALRIKQRRLKNNEDEARKKYLLTVILGFTISVLFMLGLIVVWNYTHASKYTGIDPRIFLGMMILYAYMLYMAKSGHVSASSLLLVSTEMVGAIYSGWNWGASLPETLLLTALVIVTTGVLFGATAGFSVATCMIAALTVLGFHEAQYLNVPDWRYDEITLTNVMTYSAMFLFISFIGWLSNREVHNSLNRARVSEKLLELERNTLEQKVSERTEELVIGQRKHIAELEHTVRIGELSRGIMHDMMSPMSSIALYIDELINSPDKYNNDATKEMLDKTLEASRRMRDFMESTRKFIDPYHIHLDSVTDLYKELTVVKDLLAYKARMADVQILIPPQSDLKIKAHPFRIHQVLINVISNAIEACADTETTGYARLDQDKSQCRQKKVDIQSSAVDDFVRIYVSDTGCGMSTEKIKSLFIRPETTKKNGSGIGLISMQTIIEKELGGKIKILSAENIGTTIIITLPISLSAHQKAA